MLSSSVLRHSSAKFVSAKAPSAKVVNIGSCCLEFYGFSTERCTSLELRLVEVAGRNGLDFPEGFFNCNCVCQYQFLL